jgi:hypothetical protein
MVFHDCEKSPLLRPQSTPGLIIKGLDNQARKIVMVNHGILLRYRVGYQYLDTEEYLEIFRGKPKIEQTNDTMNK